MRIGLSGEIEVGLYVLANHVDKSKCHLFAAKEILAAIERIRNEPSVAIPEAPHYHEMDIAKTLNMLKSGAKVIFTLTKMRWGTQQLRAWAGHLPHFRQSGDHADGFGNNGVFEAYGSYRDLYRMAEDKLAIKQGFYEYTRFESVGYVIWV